jgi:isoleucyl-tRNA synthetase
MPANASLVPDVKLEEKWNRIRQIRELVQKTLEETRQKGIVGSSLEACVIFKTADKATRQFLEETKNLWPEIAIVSAVEIHEGATDLEIQVVHAKGTKCARCWQWKEDVGTHPHTDICGRCEEVLSREGLTVEENETVSA